MNNRKVKFNKIKWKPQYDMKKNITYIFEKNLTLPKQKPTGFFNETQHEIEKEFYQCRENIFQMLKKEKLTLEECYSFFYILQLNKETLKCEELKQRIGYVVTHMEKECPHLINLQKDIQIGNTFDVNF